MLNEVISLNDYKKSAIQAAIRRLAGTVGTRYGYWPTVKATMREHSIDPQDVVDVLAKCSVLETQRLGLVDRYLVVGADLDGRRLLVLLVLSHELSTIEVVSLDVKLSS